MTSRPIDELIAALSRLVIENPGAPISLQLPDGTAFEVDMEIDPYAHDGVIVVPVAEPAGRRPRGRR